MISARRFAAPVTAGHHVCMAARGTSREDRIDGDSQRPCARLGWCAQATVTPLPDGSLRRDPALGPRAFCDRDRGIIRRDLDDLPYLYTCLAVEIGRTGGGSPVRVPFGPRLPLRADIDALLRTTADVLVSWHERVAAVARLSFPEGDDALRRRAGFAVSAAAAVLSAHLDALLALAPEPMRRAIPVSSLTDLPEDTPGIVHPVYAETVRDLAGADAGLEILELRRLARAVLGETKARPEELLGVPCRQEDCDRLTLRRAELPSDPDAPAWWSECSACGDRMAEDEYRDWTRRYAAWAQGRTVPVLENLPGVA